MAKSKAKAEFWVEVPPSPKGSIKSTQSKARMSTSSVPSSSTSAGNKRALESDDEHDRNPDQKGEEEEVLIFYKKPKKAEPERVCRRGCEGDCDCSSSKQKQGAKKVVLGGSKKSSSSSLKEAGPLSPKRGNNALPESSTDRTVSHPFGFPPSSKSVSQPPVKTVPTLDLSVSGSPKIPPPVPPKPNVASTSSAHYAPFKINSFATDPAAVKKPKDKVAKSKDAGNVKVKKPREPKEPKEAKKPKEPKPKESKAKKPVAKNKKSTLPTRAASPSGSLSSLSSLSPSPEPVAYVPFPLLSTTESGSPHSALSPLPFPPPLSYLALQQFTMRFLSPANSWRYKDDFAQRKVLQGLVGMIDESEGIRKRDLNKLEEVIRELNGIGGDKASWGVVAEVLTEYGWNGFESFVDEGDDEDEVDWDWEGEADEGRATRGKSYRIGEKQRVEICFGVIEKFLLDGSSVRDAVLEGFEKEKELISYQFQERMRIRGELKTMQEEWKKAISDVESEEGKKLKRKEAAEPLKLKADSTERELQDLLHHKHLLFSTLRPRFAPVAVDSKLRTYYMATPHPDTKLPSDSDDGIDWWNRLGWEVLVHGVPFEGSAGAAAFENGKAKAADDGAKPKEWFAIHRVEDINQLVRHLQFLEKAEDQATDETELTSWLKSFKVFKEVEVFRAKSKGKGKA